MAIERLRFDEQPERLPPHNLEAEEAVLGSVLMDRSVIGRVAPIVEPRDFYRERNGTIFKAMLDLQERREPVDYLTLIDELDRREQLMPVGGTTYVAQLLGAVPTPIHAEEYAKRVADAAFARRLMSGGGKVATLGFEFQYGPEELYARALRILTDVLATRRVDTMVEQEDAVREAMEYLEARSDPERRAATNSTLPTTFRFLDDLLGGGFEKGDLVLLGGRPGMGKSAFAGELLRMMCGVYPSIKAAYFTLEMTTRAMILRQLSAATAIELAVWRAPVLSRPQSVSLGQGLAELANLNIGWDQSPSQSIDRLRTKVTQRSLTRGLDIVVVDHIQLMDGPDDTQGNRTAQVTAISQGLKAIAKEENIVVVALCQLSRRVEERPNKRPVLSDLRDSGSLEQDADVVAFLYREEYYTQTETNGGIGLLDVAKNRNGPTGAIDLLWNPRTTRYRGTEGLPGYNA